MGSCVADWDWTLNASGQSPCDVAQLWRDFCSSSGAEEACWCNTAVYSLDSACSGCSGSPIVALDSWGRTDCAGFNVTLFQGTHPTSFATPSWAFLPIHGIFNSTEAEDPSTSNSPQDPLPQSSSTGASSSSVGLPSISSPSTTTSSTLPSASAVSLESSQGSHVGAIAGGIIGAVIGVALVLGVVLWIVIRWRRARTAPSAAYKAVYGTTEAGLEPSLRPFSSVRKSDSSIPAETSLV